jgi:inner membrane protein
MATLGHIAVGLAAARIHKTQQTGSPPKPLAMAFWGLLAVLPDVDFFGLVIGIEYGTTWGHRGATHSFAFALAVGAAIGIVAPAFGVRALRTAVVASLVIASHPILDTLTNGGRGCALLYPFDNTRYFSPWNPLPVAPLGLDLLSPYGLWVMGFELVVFSPLWLYAIWPTRRRKAISVN